MKKGTSALQTVVFLGEQGWRSGESAVVRALASHQCVPGSIPEPGVICGLSLLLVLFSAPRGFSPGPPVFYSPQKPTFPNSNSIWNCQALYHEPLAWVIAQAFPVFDIKFDLHLIYISIDVIYTLDKFGGTFGIDLTHKSNAATMTFDCLFAWGMTR